MTLNDGVFWILFDCAVVYSSIFPFFCADSSFPSLNPTANLILPKEFEAIPAAILARHRRQVSSSQPAQLDLQVLNQNFLHQNWTSETHFVNLDGVAAVAAAVE